MIKRQKWRDKFFCYVDIRLFGGCKKWKGKNRRTGHLRTKKRFRDVGLSSLEHLGAGGGIETIKGAKKNKLPAPPVRRDRIRFVKKIAAKPKKTIRGVTKGAWPGKGKKGGERHKRRAAKMAQTTDIPSNDHEEQREAGTRRENTIGVRRWGRKPVA